MFHNLSAKRPNHPQISLADYAGIRTVCEVLTVKDVSCKETQEI